MTLRKRNSWLLKTFAEDASGEEVLDQHPAGVAGEVGVDGLAAKFGEGLKVFAEGGVLLVFGFADCRHTAGEVALFRRTW